MDKAITVRELEDRMRPGAWSVGGFLGASESLEAVMRQDELTLRRLGISYKQIADALAKVLSAMHERYWERHDSWRDHVILRDARTIPSFSLDNLPSVEDGILDGNLQAFMTQWRGFQECPWECDTDPTWGSFDFLVLNRRLGEFVTGPGLIVHLIREHHFFEGIGSPYRCDPAKLIRVLELV
jgi:hypothetical protein